MRCRRRWCGPGGPVSASRAARASGRGCIASPPTCASTCSAAVSAEQRRLLARYVDAFESYDIDSLVKLLHEDAIQSMPPFAMWLRGGGDIGRFMLGPGAGCRGSLLTPKAANGCPAFGHYKPDPQGGHAPWALQVLEISGSRI